MLREFYTGRRQALSTAVANVAVERRASQAMRKGVVLRTVLSAVVLYALYPFSLFRWYCAISTVTFTLIAAVTNGLDNIDLQWHGRRSD